MKLIDKFVIREVGDSIVGVATGDASLVFKGIIKLNKVSAFIFKCLQTQTTKEQIIEKLIVEYEIDKVTAEKDVEEFLNTLKGANILE